MFLEDGKKLVQTLKEKVKYYQFTFIDKELS